MKPKLLSKNFYTRDTTVVAQELLGKLLVHRINGKRRSGIIVETEAYLGIDDPACHTFGGRKTKRVEAMYLHGGHSYVYQIYGLHYCFNVVTQNELKPEAVLVRALFPCEDLEGIRKDRGGKAKHLTAGPGMLCQALKITKKQNGFDLTRSDLIIEDLDIEFSKLEISKGPRIGVDYAGEAARWPLNFKIQRQALERLKQSFPSM